MAYKPMMSNDEARRRIAHQNLVYKENLLRKKQILINFQGRKLIVSKNVFLPVPWDSNLLAKTVLREVRPEDKVLDMGTGSGIQAILAASRSSVVIAVDVNPYAVKNARLNVRLNRLSSRVKVFESDLFQNVIGRFDLIIFDPPFRWTKPRDILERATADEDYKSLRTFLTTAKNYLTETGRIVIHIGTSADIKYFRDLCRKNGLKRKPLLKKSNKKGWTYFTYRLTP